VGLLPDQRIKGPKPRPGDGELLIARDSDEGRSEGSDHTAEGAGDGEAEGGNSDNSHCQDESEDQSIFGQVLALFAICTSYQRRYQIVHYGVLPSLKACDPSPSKTR